MEAADAPDSSSGQLAAETGSAAFIYVKAPAEKGDISKGSGTAKGRCAAFDRKGNSDFKYSGPYGIGIRMSRRKISPSASAVRWPPYFSAISRMDRMPKPW